MYIDFVILGYLQLIIAIGVSTVQSFQGMSNIFGYFKVNGRELKKQLK